jgi:hypothetical protein
MFLRSPRALPAGPITATRRAKQFLEVGKRHWGLTLPLAKGGHIPRRGRQAAAAWPGGVAFGGCSGALGLCGNIGRSTEPLSAVGSVRAPAAERYTTEKRSAQAPSPISRDDEPPHVPPCANPEPASSQPKAGLRVIPPDTRLFHGLHPAPCALAVQPKLSFWVL